MLHPAAIVAICVGSYVVCAIVAVQLLPPAYSEERKKQKRRVKFPTKRIGHRGGSLNGPENTMWTFQRTAADLDVIELDVAQTSDGAVVVTHDTDLQRQCGKPGRIDELSSSSLPFLSEDVPLHFPSNSHDAFHLCKDADRVRRLGLCSEPQPYCLLREVFEAFPRTPIHLDVKYPSSTLVLKVLDLIDQFDRRGLTIVGSAGEENCKALRKEIRRRERADERKMDSQNEGKFQPFLTFASFKEVAWTYAFYYLGILPLVPLSFDCFSIPLITASKKSLFAQRNFGNCCIRAIASSLLTAPSLWRHLRRRGIVVLGFVLNDPDEWDEVRDWPIDGIMTDDVLKLSYHLKHCAHGCMCPAGHEECLPSKDPKRSGSALETHYGSVDSPGSLRTSR